MEEINLMDFLSVLWRRKRLFFATAATVFLLAAISAFHWSNYRSVATVEVALPEVAMQMINEESQLSREAMADLRISYLQQKVLSTGSLVEIITKFNLYAEARKTRPVADIVGRMRRDIRLEFVGSSGSATKTSTQRSTIAFNLSFDYDQPLLAQQVTNELVSRFLDEDIKQRQSQAKETTAFLSVQIKSLEESLAEQEKKIAEFRSQYGDTRPDALAFNQSAMTSLMMSVQNLDAQISSTSGTLGSLQAQLASLDPYSRVIGEGQVLTTPTIQLRAAKAEYAALSAKYGAEHPDVIKARRQVESLSRVAGGRPKNLVTTEDIAPLKAMVSDLQAKLSEAQKTKGAENPDVIALQNQLQGLEKQIEEKSKKMVSFDWVKQDADNPAYLAVVAQIQATIERSKALEEQRAALQEQMNKYQKAVIENPDVEKKMAELSRDYATAQERYRQLQAKKMEAEMNEAIENDRVGQRLLIINPPELPTKTQPSRLTFLLAGFVLAFVSGFAVVVGAQFMTQSVVGARHLESLIGVPPLVVVPHIVTRKEQNSVTRRKAQLVALGLVGLVLAVVIFSIFVMPLDVFISVIGMKLGLY